MRLHIEALFTHNAEGLLEDVNEPGGGPAPRLFIGRTREGPLLRFRHDVDPEIRRALELAASEDATVQSGDLDVPTDATKYRDILALAAAVEKSWSGRRTPSLTSYHRPPAWFRLRTRTRSCSSS
jgi:hypothetical protein